MGGEKQGETSFSIFPPCFFCQLMAREGRLAAKMVAEKQGKTPLTIFSALMFLPVDGA